MPYLITICRVTKFRLNPDTFKLQTGIWTFVFTHGLGFCFQVLYRKDRGVRRDMREA